MVLFLGCATLFRAQAQTPEFRAAWADVFHAGTASAAEVDTMVSTLASGHYNAVIIQVVGYMDNAVGASHGAMYKSSILPWSSRVKSNFDPLAYLCQQAHANGIEVHAWLGGSGGAMYRVSTSFPPAGNTTLAAHPEWFIAPLTNSEGGTVVAVDGNYCLDMGSPDVQEYIVSIVRELVTNYPIDGINWDDELNGTGYNQGFGYPAYSQASYARSGLARFRINTGYVGTPSNTDVNWSNYRRRFKNELMARVQAEIQSIKTNPRQPLRHTSAALAYSPVPTSCTFTGSVPYTYYCDWAGMLQNGWLDAVIPQTYSASTFTNWANLSASCWQYNRRIFPGIGGYLTNLVTIANLMRHTRNLGLEGNSIYSYGVPRDPNLSDNWWSYAATNVYTNVVGTPPMPWRDPATATEGIVWGRVKDHLSGGYVDDATVLVSGRSAVKTDANGYYVATLVPATAAGTLRSVTASKTGMALAVTNGLVLAGDIVRFDLELNAIPPVAAPSGLSATAAGLAQINLAWTDNATNETGLVVSRGTISGGPYTDIASLPANSTAFTNTGLASATTYYYVVRATNALAVSANSAQAGATTFTDPAPAITWQPMDLTVVIGGSATFSVAASGQAPLAYQWSFNGVAIPGANASSLTLSPAQYAQGGIYAVLVSNAYGSIQSSNAALTVLTAPVTIQIANPWNITAGSRNYVTTGNTERGICLNPLTGHVLLASRSTTLSGSLGIFVLNADTGAQVGTMNTTGVSGGTFALNKIDAADDGVIYGANLTTASGTSPLIIYRWANEGAAPTVAYTGAPDGGTTPRWGDTFSVNGAGVNTRILVSGSSATNTMLFTTVDGTNFTANALNPSPAVLAGEFWGGFQLVGDDTFYSKNRSATVCKVFNYDTATHSASVSQNITPVDGSIIAIAALTNYSLLAGVLDDNSTTHTSHGVKVYDISTPASPVVVTNFYFPAIGGGTNSSNSNWAGQADADGTRIVALDTQNGVVALQVVVDLPPPRINRLTLLAGNRRQFELNADPGNFVIQASSDLATWHDLAVTRTNGWFEVTDPAANSTPRYYRTRQ